MGSFEKLVVLTVIFLSAVVLTISLNHGGEDGGGSSPSETRREQSNRQGDPESVRLDDGAFVSGTELASAAVADLDESGLSGSGSAGRDSAAVSSDLDVDSAGNALLSAEAAPRSGEVDGNPFRQQPGGAAQVNSSPSGVQPVEGQLITLEGLIPSAVDGFYVYQPSIDDTWTNLSMRYYGTVAYQRELRQENDGADLSSGNGVYILVNPGGDVTGDRDAAVPQPSRGLPSMSRPADSRGALGDAAANGATHRTYNVQTGDTLSSIAYDHYGRASLWRRIWDANRDVLPNPDALKLHQELRIP